MTTMIREVYDAFKAAGVDEEKAAAAAGALSQYDQDRRALATKQDLQEVKQEIARIDGDLRLLRWMIVFNMALTVAVLLKLII